MKHIALGALFVGSLATQAVGQDLYDEPGPGVARLSLIDGDVIVRRGDSGEFIAGERNAPLVESDHVTTLDRARAEIQFDWANMIRLAPNSEVRMAELEGGSFFIQLADGTATFSVLRDSSSLVEISTPNVSLRPLAQGTYRIMVRPDGSTQITVRAGEAEIFTAAVTEVLTPGQTMEVSGNPAEPALLTLIAIPRDEWDRWNEARDRDLERTDSYRYVSRDIYGAEDLAGHGRWVYDSPYGWVWVPDVSATWTPYRAGRWSWVDHYGWTWISSDLWGWAPYHYGRWYYANSYGWVWYPGATGPRHHWRPALVAFFGWGSGAGVNVSLTFGFGNVGWVPLAPHEIYRPWYGRSPRTRVSVTNITVVNNINIVKRYRNARFVGGRNGVTSVPTGDFGRNRVTANNFVRVRDRDLTRAGEIRGPTPFEPSRASRQFSDRSVTVRDLPQRNIDDGQFVSRGRRGDRATSETRDGRSPQTFRRERQNDDVVNRGSAARRRGEVTHETVTIPGDNRNTRSEERADSPIPRTNPQAVVSPRRIREPRAEPGRIDRQQRGNDPAGRQRGEVTHETVTVPGNNRRNSPIPRTNRARNDAGPLPVQTTAPAVQERPRRVPAPEARPTPEDRFRTRPSATLPDNRRGDTRKARNSNSTGRRGDARSGPEVRSEARPTPNAPAFDRSNQRGVFRENSGSRDRAPANSARSNEEGSNSRNRRRR